MSASEPTPHDASPALDPDDPLTDPAAAERALAVGPPDVPPLAGIRTAIVLLTLFGVVIAIALSGKPILTDDSRTPLPVRAPLVQPLPDFRIDPNAATEAELMLLPAIGPVLARNIVESREADGPFRFAEDLDRVRRIGPKTVEKLRPFITLPPAAPDSDQPSPGSAPPRSSSASPPPGG